MLINGLHAKTGGGVTYLRNMLPLLAADPELELTLFLKREQLPLFSPIDERVRVRTFDFGGGLFRLLAWEQTVLPVLARRMGARVTFSPANFGPLLAPGPVILLRNALEVAKEESRPAKRLYWAGLSLMTRLSLLGCRRAIAVSEYARRALSRGFGNKTTVIHHGLSPLFHPTFQPKTAPPFLLVVADIYVQKNLHGLIDALPGIVAAHPEVHLFIAGREVDPDYAAGLRRRIAALGLDNAVLFLGGVAPDTLNDLYNGCTVFVFPSTVETFGNPLVEAMACGACIASSNTTAMPEILGEAGCYFDPADPADMTARILSLLGDEALRAERGRAALARAQRFSWAGTAEAVARVLKEAGAADGKPVLLWVWLAAVLALYLAQFGNYVHSLAALLGLG
ncbi:MAG: glycosyltransferase family 4 protein [Alphaproteobacteria bacterium]|nr:glycosyltransferase family 4 protein [Alphaproteobacteria bacterium]